MCGAIKASLVEDMGTEIPSELIHSGHLLGGAVQVGVMSIVIPMVNPQ